MAEEEANTNKLLEYLDVRIEKNNDRMDFMLNQVKRWVTSLDDLPGNHLQKYYKASLLLHEENEIIAVIKKMAVIDKQKVDAALQQLLGAGTDGDEGGEGGDTGSVRRVYERLQQVAGLQVEAMCRESMREAEAECAHHTQGDDNRLSQIQELVQKYKENGCKHITVDGRTSGSVSSDDGIDFLSEQSEVRRCPFLHTVITHPVRNIHCGHVYDKASVDLWIKSRKKERCPVSGCTNAMILKKADVVDADDM